MKRRKKITRLQLLVSKTVGFLRRRKLISRKWKHRIERIVQYRSFYFAWPTSRQTRHRRVLLAMQGYCEHCGYNDVRSLTVDHMVAIADGGKDSLSNKQLLCSQCHMNKTKADNRRRSGAQ